MKNRPFFLIGLIGILIIANAYWLEKTFPAKAPYMPNGFSKPITFFEFVQSPIEVEAFFGLSDYDFDSCKFIKQMDKGNKIDFLFAFIYSTFFFLFFKKLAKESGIKWYKIGMILAITALTADVLENMQLLQISSKLAKGGYDSNIKLLFIFTRIKWSSLSIGFAIFGLWLMKLPGVLHIMGYIAWIPIIFGMFAMMNRGVMTELFTRSINIMFFVGISYCFMYQSNMERTQQFFGRSNSA